MRSAPNIVLSKEEQKTLRRLANSRTTSVRLARRAQIVLLAAAGNDNEAIAERLRIGRVQVGRWRERYARGGLAAIERDLPRGGRPAKANAAEIVRLTTQTLPEAATQWSTRTLAAKVGGATPRCCACGSDMGSSRTWSSPSRFRAIRASWRSSRTSWGCI